MRTFDTPGPITASLDIPIGTIHLEATDRAETTVEIRPSDPTKQGDVAAAEATTVSYANGRLTVKGPRGWRPRLSRRSESVDVTVALPNGSRLDVENGVGSVTGTGSFGDVGCTVGVGDIDLEATASLEAKAGVGDVTVDRVAGRGRVVAGSGAVRLGLIDGPLTVKASNGDASIDEVTGDVRVSAANGAISIGIARAGVVAKTANGTVHLGEVAAGSAVVQSAFGELHVGVRDGVAAYLDLHTRFGTVRNDLDASDGPPVDGETVEIHAQTSFGDITIARSVPSGAVGQGA